MFLTLSPHEMITISLNCPTFSLLIIMIVCCCCCLQCVSPSANMRDHAHYRNSYQELVSSLNWPCCTRWAAPPWSTARHTCLAGGAPLQGTLCMAGGQYRALLQQCVADFSGARPVNNWAASAVQSRTGSFVPCSVPAGGWWGLAPCPRLPGPNRPQAHPAVSGHHLRRLCSSLQAHHTGGGLPPWRLLPGMEGIMLWVRCRSPCARFCLSCSHAPGPPLPPGGASLAGGGGPPPRAFAWCQAVLRP
jgi:hypothetical protein